MRPFVKSAMALGIAGALTLAALTPSLARSRTWAAVGAGVVAGAILGAAAADARYYDDRYYAAGPIYVEPGYEAYSYEPRGYVYRGDYDAYGYAAPGGTNLTTGNQPSYDRERTLRGTDY